MLHIARQSGFTLIEMIVSLTLFSVIITITVGALLSLIGANDQLRNEQSVMTNLAFALDSMSREIRTGSYYYCANTIEQLNDQEGLGLSNQDCDPGMGLSFREGGSSITGTSRERISYFFRANKIWRLVGDDDATTGGQSMTAEGIHIAEMRFWVTGSATLEGSNNTEQPTVTIFIEARDSATGRPYYVQTTVTQRALDL